MKHTMDAEFPPPAADSLIDRILHAQRSKLAAAFGAFSQIHASTDSVLEVRLTCSPVREQSAGLNSQLRDIDPARVTVHSIEASWPAKQVTSPVAKGERATQDKLHLPYRDGQFDWCFCSEVLEHVGGIDKQYALVKELGRVARKGVFVTASNRRHPMEFHTRLPLLHWLPDPAWRRLLKWLGKSAWASESSLSLVDADALYRIARLLPGKPRHDVGHKRVAGIKAHFFLMIEKQPAGAAQAA